jgi:DNA-binding CsgD family transcriptional regulator
MAITLRSELTPTEQQTALMAAAGRSNKEIAAEFVVSVRTVENQLQRVYGKLGISGRKELADTFRVIE